MVPVHLNPDSSLVERVAEITARPTPPELDTVVSAVRERFGDALEAVIHYGSVLHTRDPRAGIVDLFVVVRDYRSAYVRPHLRLFNAVLPPNWFYLEVEHGEETIRAKYSVLSRAHFTAGASRWFHSYVWARMAQPSRILWTVDDEALRRVHSAIGDAVATFHREAVQTLKGEVPADDIWVGGLESTYAAELRTEGRERASWLLERNAEDYRVLTSHVGPRIPGRPLTEVAPGRYDIESTPRSRALARVRWRIRIVYGKVISTIRLGKAALTFENSAEYVLQKIERHTGRAIEVTPFMRRHPFLSAPWALVAFLRRGVIR